MSCNIFSTIFLYCVHGNWLDNLGLNHYIKRNYSEPICSKSCRPCQKRWRGMSNFITIFCLRNVLNRTFHCQGKKYSEIRNKEEIDWSLNVQPNGRSLVLRVPRAHSLLQLKEQDSGHPSIHSKLQSHQFHINCNPIGAIKKILKKGGRTKKPKRSLPLHLPKCFQNPEPKQWIS